MKKILMLCAAASTILALTGCATVQVAPASTLQGQDLSTSGKSVAHISASSYGLYLFSIPLITGALDNLGMPCLVTDTVNSNALATVVAAKAKNLDAGKVVDLASQNNSAGFIFYWKQSFVSGNAVK